MKKWQNFQIGFDHFSGFSDSRPKIFLFDYDMYLSEFLGQNNFFSNGQLTPPIEGLRFT